MNQEEIKIITSTIDLREHFAGNIMTKMADVFKLSVSDQLNKKTIDRIIKYSYSRIPVFDSEGICVGILWAKNLLDYQRYQEKSIKNSGIKLTAPLIISSQTNLLEALSILQQKKINLCLVSESDSIPHMRASRRMSITSRNDKIMSGQFKPKIVGLLTLKDIFEKIVEKDFEDHDNHLRSMISQTYIGAKNDPSNVDSSQKLVEMQDQEEYSQTKAPLLKNEVR